MRSISIAFSLLLAPLLLLAQDVEIAAVVSRTEGPTVDQDGNVYFSDFFGQRIMMLDREGVLSVYREESNVAVGLVIDAENRLVAVEGANFFRDGNKAEGVPRVTRTDLNSGEMVVLVDSYRGEPFGLLNDVTFDGKGRLYVTDPGASAVYRIDGRGQIDRILDDAANGIQISPDENTLYVGVRGHIVAYDLSSEGTASNGRVHYQFEPGFNADGMSIDTEGTLYATVKPGRGMSLRENTGVYLISRLGELLEIMPIADSVTNITFAGSDMRTLYVTAGNTLYKLRSDVPGLSR